MLHLRSAPRVLARLGSSWSRWRSDLAASDPGLLRLQMSMRGTLSVFLATCAALLAGHLGGFAPVECAGGVTLSMMAPFLMREPTLRQRQRTLLALLVPAVAATLLTAVLHGHGPAGDSVFLLLVFLCFLLGPRSPRGIGLGLVGIVTTYVGLYLELPPATLPVQLAAQAAVLPIVALACFVVVPMDPAATLRRAVAAVQARAAQAIRRAPSSDAAGFRRELLRLNEAALAADDQLALIDPGMGSPVRARLVEVELWTARLIEALRVESSRAAGPDPRQATRLSLHARRITRGGRYAMRPNQVPPGTVLAAVVALGNAVHALGAASQADAPPPGPAIPAPVVRGPLAWRMAIRATLASGLAMAGGMALSPQRWFWAVITVYVVFLGARSRGDTIHKGAQRLGGTLLGIASGLVLALTVAGDPVLESGLLLLSVFGMYYFFLVSYTIGIFCVTVMLGLLYGMMGAPLETVLVLRLEETVIGTAAAMLVAGFVLPSRTRDQVRLSGRAVLAQLAVVVRACAAALAGQPSAAPIEAMRPVDRKVADLKLALAPLAAGRALLRRSRVDRPVSALLDCVHWTRVLAAEAQAGCHRADAMGASDLVALARRLDALAQGAAEPAPPLATRAGDEVGKSIHALHAAVTTLAERVEVGTYETFSME